MADNYIEIVDAQLRGEKGDAGVGVVAGGTVGQVLAKINSTNYNTEWKTLAKSDLGLGNVDNTSDANKPISIATQSALDLKLDIDDLPASALSLGTTSNTACRGDHGTTAYYHSQFFSGNPHNTTPSEIGLGNVNNTSDTNKPLSSAAIAALAVKADLVAGKVPLSQIPALANLTLGEVETSAYRGDRGKAAYDHSLLASGNPHGLTKTDLSLGNVDNTSDVNKPISSAMQAVLDVKADLVDGQVPASQLGNLSINVEEYANLAAFPETGVNGTYYKALDSGLVYVWSGSTYTSIAGSITLGETLSTAYRGDRGKTAYDHSQVVTGNPHGLARSDLNLATSDSPSFVTCKLSGLSDGYLPKHTSDAVGLANSPIWTDGTKTAIGHAVPLLNFDVLGTAGLPATSGTTQVGALRLQTGDNGVLDFGVVASGAGAWLQSTDKTNLATWQSLLLNPRGGNIGIGVTGTPAATIEVAGNMKSSRITTAFTQVSAPWLTKGATGGGYNVDDQKAANLIMHQQEEVQTTGSATRSVRDCLMIQHQDNDVTNYNTGSTPVRISEGLKVAMTGAYSAGAWQAQTKDMHGIFSFVEGRTDGWNDRGLMAIGCWGVQHGAGVNTNEFHVMNPVEAFNKSVQMIAIHANVYANKAAYSPGYNYDCYFGNNCGTYPIRAGVILASSSTYTPLYYANLAAFPVTGEVGRYYIANDTHKAYVWTASTYTEYKGVNSYQFAFAAHTANISTGGCLLSAGQSLDSLSGTKIGYDGAWDAGEWVVNDYTYYNQSLNQYGFVIADIARFLIGTDGINIGGNINLIGTTPGVIQFDDYDKMQYHRADNYFSFFIADTERMTIHNAGANLLGNLGITGNLVFDSLDFLSYDKVNNQYEFNLNEVETFTISASGITCATNLQLAGDNVNIFFATDDYLAYDRLNNLYSFYIGASQIATVNATGFGVVGNIVTTGNIYFDSLDYLKYDRLVNNWEYRIADVVKCSIGAGGMVIVNNAAYYGTNTTGSTIALVKLDSSNDIWFGSKIVQEHTTGYIGINTTGLSVQFTVGGSMQATQWVGCGSGYGLIAGGVYSLIDNIDAATTVTINRNGTNTRVMIGGVLKTLSVDGSGFVKGS